MSSDKSDLRREWKSRRDTLAPESRAASSEAICKHIVQFAQSRRIRAIGAFWPLGSEVDLRPLTHWHPEWLFYFPKITSTSPPRLSWGTEPLEPGPWGLREPVFAQHFKPPVPLLLVPGLAFDPRGFRLGYGGGYYDALLATLGPEVLTVAVGYDLQKAANIPVDPHDQPVHALITQSGLTWFEKPEVKV